MDDFDRAKRRIYMRRYCEKHRENWNAYQRERYAKKKAENEERRRIAEREKLIELLCETHRCIDLSDIVKEHYSYVAEYLIANGVSIQIGERRTDG